MVFDSTVMRTKPEIFVPLKKNEAYSARLLLKCLENIKAWMALNFLNFNEKKSEVMVFGDNTQPGFLCSVRRVDCHKPWGRWSVKLLVI